MMPARSSSLCETTSASAGSSRSVGMKYCDQRIGKHFRPAGRSAQPQDLECGGLTPLSLCQKPARKQGQVALPHVRASDTQHKIQSAAKVGALQIFAVCRVAIPDVPSIE